MKRSRFLGIVAGVPARDENSQLGEAQRASVREWSRSLMDDVTAQPQTVGVDLGSWTRSVEWGYDPKTLESWVVKDHGWKRIDHA